MPTSPPPSESSRYPTRYKTWNPDGSGRHSHPQLPPPRPTRTQSAVEWLLFAVFGVLMLLAAVALYSAYSPAHKRVPNNVAQGFHDDRINIVLFGVGGENHPRHDELADAILMVSLKPSTKQAAVVSVPRDLWVHLNGYGTHRINYAHEIGNQGGYPGEGPGLLCDTISRVFQQPVHAYVRVDFSAFEKLIDDVGGVDIYCQRSFYDYLFRDGFAQGWHHLTGKRALAYARYRYVLGPDGDNFARELRQQQVISAMLSKLQQLGPQQTIRLLQAGTTLSKATQTNLTTTQMVTLYRAFHDIRPVNIRHVSLKPLTETFMVTRLGEPGEAVRPLRQDFSELQHVEETIFSSARQISTGDQILVTNAPISAQPARRLPNSILSAVD
jgi:LCP family protein required for cell wall assembly